jgi:hypothetical protein
MIFYMMSCSAKLNDVALVCEGYANASGALIRAAVKGPKISDPLSFAGG